VSGTPTTATDAPQDPFAAVDLTAFRAELAAQETPPEATPATPPPATPAPVQANPDAAPPAATETPDLAKQIADLTARIAELDQTAATEKRRAAAFQGNLTKAEKARQAAEQRLAEREAAIDQQLHQALLTETDPAQRQALVAAINQRQSERDAVAAQAKAAEEAAAFEEQKQQVQAAYAQLQRNQEMDARSKALGTLASFVDDHGKELGLAPEDLADVKDALLTEEEAALALEMPIERLLWFLGKRGAKVEQLLAEKVQAVKTQNRTAAQTSGAFAREVAPSLTGTPSKIDSFEDAFAAVKADPRLRSAG